MLLVVFFFHISGTTLHFFQVLLKHLKGLQSKIFKRLGRC